MKKIFLFLAIGMLALLIFPVEALQCDDSNEHEVIRLVEPAQKSEGILQIQKILKSTGYYQGKLDGEFGPITEKAVKEFQKNMGMVVDGIIGPKTWVTFVEVYEKPVVGKPAKESPQGEVTIHIDIDKLRLEILDDGKVFKQYPIARGKSKTPSPVGEYKIVSKGKGWGTGFGTRWLGLNVPWGLYGIHGTNKPWSIGRAESHGCFRMYNKHVEEIYPWIPIGTRVYITGYTPKFTGFKRPLKIKTSGQDVVMLQNALKQIGFGIDAADGRYGALTEFAVKLFEAYHMLPVDGEADMEMIKRLERYFQKK